MQDARSSILEENQNIEFCVPSYWELYPEHWVGALGGKERHEDCPLGGAGLALAIHLLGGLFYS